MKIKFDKVPECLEEQYPKEICSVSFAKITGIQLGIIIVGFKLPSHKTSRNKR